MTSLADVMPAAEQVDRCSRYSIAVSVDMHCHCLPGLDDGPTDLAASLALCRALVRDGTTDVIATPHRLDEHDDGRTTAAAVRSAVVDLSAVLVAERVPLRLHAGADVRVAESLLPLLDADKILTLADGRAFILLELPHGSVIDLTRLLADLAERGLTGIVSHPERHSALMAKPEQLSRWVDAGAIFQVTAGSLLGQFGPRAEAAGWQLVESGLAAIIASDAHDAESRPPSMTAALAAITARKGHLFARRVCVENPLHVLNGNRAVFVRKNSRPSISVRRRRWWERAS